MNEALENLLKHPRVWRARSPRNTEAQEGLASGYPELDRHLPGGGWPRHALTEILIEHHGTGELKLLMPALARLSAGDDDRKASFDNNQDAGWIAWIAPPFQPYPPALLQWGVDLSRILIVHTRKGGDTLWAAEQALSSGNCAAVLLWENGVEFNGVEPEFRRRKSGSTPLNSHATSRRLQLAAEKGQSWAIVFRAGKTRSQISAAALRLELVKGDRGTDVIILKSRGGRPIRVRNVIQDKVMSTNKSYVD